MHGVGYMYLLVVLNGSLRCWCLLKLEITTKDLFTQFTKIHKLCIGHKLCNVLYIAQSNAFAIAAIKKTALTRDSNLLTASKES